VISLAAASSGAGRGETSCNRDASSAFMRGSCNRSPALRRYCGRPQHARSRCFTEAGKVLHHPRGCMNPAIYQRPSARRRPMWMRPHQPLVVRGADGTRRRRGCPCTAFTTPSTEISIRPRWPAIRTGSSRRPRWLAGPIAGEVWLPDQGIAPATAGRDLVPLTIMFGDKPWSAGRGRRVPGERRHPERRPSWRAHESVAATGAFCPQ